MTTAKQRSEANVRASMPRPVVNVRVAMTRQQWEDQLAHATYPERGEFEKLLERGLITFTDEP